ncbi:hypothetical protein TNIN_450261 [Trichonephila inaurata madagascariensis]|uniref:Uncharacterized protein n=1 Tax=Trichonephila inaurata madagascariensis TaxID=2747483 RepID=A0A8X6Y7T0_9ARAC|nr:hypothetical protein TNIN_450261 [Trichonephila inaurata madagascariensis]
MNDSVWCPNVSDSFKTANESLNNIPIHKEDNTYLRTDIAAKVGSLKLYLPNCHENQLCVETPNERGVLLPDPKQTKFQQLQCNSEP